MNYETRRYLSSIAKSDEGKQTTLWKYEGRERAGKDEKGRCPKAKKGKGVEAERSVAVRALQPLPRCGPSHVIQPFSSHPLLCLSPSLFPPPLSLPHSFLFVCRSSYIPPSLPSSSIPPSLPSSSLPSYSLPLALILLIPSPSPSSFSSHPPSPHPSFLPLIFLHFPPLPPEA